MTNMTSVRTNKRMRVVLAWSLLLHMAYGHPSSLECAADGQSRLRIGATIMKQKTIQSPTSSSSKMKVTYNSTLKELYFGPWDQTNNPILFAARVDGNATLHSNTTNVLAKCSNQVYLNKASTIPDAMYTVRVNFGTNKTTTNLVVGYANTATAVKIINMQLTNGPAPGPAPGPVPVPTPAPTPTPTPTPSSSISPYVPKQVGRGVNVSLGNLDGYTMNFHGISLEKHNNNNNNNDDDDDDNEDNNNDNEDNNEDNEDNEEEAGEGGGGGEAAEDDNDAIQFEINLVASQHTWIGFGFANNGMMGSQKEGSELYICLNNNDASTFALSNQNIVQKFWSTGATKPTKGVPVQGSSCNYSQNGVTTMRFSRLLLSDAANSSSSSSSSRAITPGKEQSIIFAHGQFGDSTFQSHGSNKGSMIYNFEKGGQGHNTKMKPTLLLYVTDVLLLCCCLFYMCFFLFLITFFHGLCLLLCEHLFCIFFFGILFVN